MHVCCCAFLKYASHTFPNSGWGTFLIKFSVVAEGVAKNKVQAKHHPPTLKSSLRASQLCCYFFVGGVGEKSYEVSKFVWGGSLRKNYSNAVSIFLLLTTSYSS